ncbi:MAG: urea transporter, partial [Alistipes sp.]|nr:urea transporter [Alistipes sp.]
MTTSTHSRIFDVGIFGFIKILLRGAAQVMFQCNSWCGLLFIVGIFWGAYSSGMP